MMSVLDEELGDLLDDVDKAEDTVGEDQGPLQEPAKSAVEAKLISADAHIDTALNLIGNLGSADETNLPGSLPAIADECVALADQAHSESLEAVPDRTLIGSRVKTIRWMMNVERGYRDLAGIQVPVDD